MGLKRRAFLQRTGSILAAIGVHEAGLSVLARRYYRALAQPGPRKLALLVGINQYASEVYDRGLTASPSLSGCVTDVELQKELLIYRFGFSDRDILTLTDQQATRQNIETAFVEHLSQQARPDDVVVFHFSGYGTLLQLQPPGTEADTAIQSGLVPVDGKLPLNGTPIVNDLPEETLWLLLQSLQTERVTTVLDVGYTSGGTALQGNLRIRSRLSAIAGQLNEAELDFQEQLRQRLETDSSPSGQRSDCVPGAVLAAAGPTQLATRIPTAIAPGEKAFEGQWYGFKAGLFTCALTQRLWHATPATTLRTNLSRAIATVEQSVGKQQQPQQIQVCLAFPDRSAPVLPSLAFGKGRAPDVLSQPAYFLAPQVPQRTDGVVTAIDEDGVAAKVWLAGLPAAVLAYYGSNSLLSLVSPEGQVVEGNSPTSGADQVQEHEPDSRTPGQRQLLVQYREGLQVKARLCCLGDSAVNRVRVGEHVQEAIRVLPREIKLSVALDASLGKIERVDATSAFAALPWVALGMVGEQPNDYLFGRIQEEKYSYAQNSYGLFSLCRSLIPNTLGSGGEAVKTAVKRLEPQLQALLAAKLLQLTVNEGSSQLEVKASLEMTLPESRVLMRREAGQTPPAVTEAGVLEAEHPSEMLKIPNGSRIRYKLENDSDRSVHALLLGLDSSGTLIALYTKPIEANTGTPQGTPTLIDETIQPGATSTIPRSSASFEWEISGPPGPTQVYLIFSRAPFTQTLTALTESVRPISEAQRINSPSNPLAVAQAGLQDLNNVSASAVQTAGIATEGYALDVNAWATLNFVYQVV